MAYVLMVTPGKTFAALTVKLSIAHGLVFLLVTFDQFGYHR